MGQAPVVPDPGRATARRHVGHLRRSRVEREPVRQQARGTSCSIAATPRATRFAAAPRPYSRTHNDLLRPNVVEAFTRIVAEPSSHGVGGSVDDTLAFSRPWGFDLAAIAVPVLLTYGVKDVAAPVGQGRWLAVHIPTVEVWESQTGGHLPEEPEAEIAQTLAWLTGQTVA